MTLINFHGACQSGLGCLYASLLIKLVDGKSLCSVGPFAFGGAWPFPLTINALLALLLLAASSLSDIPSIIPAILSSDARSGAAAFAFFARRWAAEAAAPACFAAKAGGSSCASLYSLRIREATLAWSDGCEGGRTGGAVWYGSEGTESSIDGEAKSSAYNSRVRFAFRRSASSATFELSTWAMLLLLLCVRNRGMYYLSCSCSLNLELLWAWRWRREAAVSSCMRALKPQVYHS
jgi:hypothetical protein